MEVVSGNTPRGGESRYPPRRMYRACEADQVMLNRVEIGQAW